MTALQKWPVPWLGNKESTCRQETEEMGPSLGQEDPLEEGMAICSSILAWEILWTAEPDGLQSRGRKESDMTEHVHTLHAISPSHDNPICLRTHLTIVCRKYIIPTHFVILSHILGFYSHEVYFSLKIKISHSDIRGGCPACPSTHCDFRGSPGYQLYTLVLKWSDTPAFVTVWYKASWRQ